MPYFSIDKWFIDNLIKNISYCESSWKKSLFLPGYTFTKKTTFMKKILLFSVLAIGLFALAFSSCNKIAAAFPAIAWSGTDVTFTVAPVSDTSLNTSIGTGTFSYDLDSLVKAQTKGAFSLSSISSFKFTSCVLTIQNPDPANNFQNFESAALSFSTNANTTPVTIGEVTNNPNTYAATLTLPVNSSVNVKNYLPSSGPMVANYSLKGKLRIPTTTTLTIKVHVEYAIN
jgi:hypothetical protein